MKEAAGPPILAIGDDLILPFQVAESAVRGRVVRLGESIDRILSAHKFPSSVSELVGEAVALVAMMGASLKFDGKLIFQAQGDGLVRMLVADYATDGALRATASFDQEAAAVRGLGALIGNGHMAITIDQGADMDRYQGVTPLDGDTLARAAVSYFDQSEQIPTAVKLAVGRVMLPGKGEVWRAGGIIAQFVPGEGGARERGEAALNAPEGLEMWERAAAFLETTQADELLDPSLSTERLLYRLFHEDGVRVFKPSNLHAECGCNADKIAAVLGRYTTEELADMVEDGFIRVSCEFCRAEYLFDEAGALAMAS